MAEPTSVDQFSSIKRALASNADLNTIQEEGDPTPSSLLDTFLKFVLKTGTPYGFNWEQVKAVVLAKFDQVTKIYEAEKPIASLPPVPNVDNYTFEEYRDRIIQCLDRFEDSPFTIGRICELLLEPKKHYDRGDKFLRAFEKCVAVTSTNGNSDMEMNGVDTTNNQIEAGKHTVDSVAENGVATKMAAEHGENGHSETDSKPTESAPHTNGDEKSDNAVSSSVDQVTNGEPTKEENKVESSTPVTATVEEPTNGEHKQPTNGVNEAEEIGRSDAPKRQLEESESVAKKIARLEASGNGVADFGEPDVEPRAEKNGHDKEMKEAIDEVAKDTAAIDKDVATEGTAV